MKRIKEYKKLFKVEGPIDLKELKKSYRGLVKEWHPDKFQDQEKKRGSRRNEYSNYRWVSFFSEYSS
jgi:DnaJ-class molecular chaperone